MTKNSGDDGDDAWQRFTEGVTPLGQRPTPRRKTPREPRATRPADPDPVDRAAFSDLLDTTGGFDVRDGETLEGRAPGIDYDTVRRLKRGAFPVQARIDLHNQNRESAKRRLQTGLAGAQRAGQRTVLVIHGRGLHSEGDAVIRRELPGWLTSPPLAQIVMAFATAQPEHGGLGALYVLVRK